MNEIKWNGPVVSHHSLTLVRSFVFQLFRTSILRLSEQSEPTEKKGGTEEQEEWTGTRARQVLRGVHIGSLHLWFVHLCSLNLR